MIFYRTYLKNKIGVQKQVERCEIPIFGGAKRRKSGAYTSYVSILNRFATLQWALRLFLRYVLWFQMDNETKKAACIS